jgi:hypothetical protein
MPFKNCDAFKFASEQDIYPTKSSDKKVVTVNSSTMLMHLMGQLMFAISADSACLCLPRNKMEQEMVVFNRLQWLIWARTCLARPFRLLFLLININFSDYPLWRFHSASVFLCPCVVKASDFPITRSPDYPITRFHGPLPVSFSQTPTPHSTFIANKRRTIIRPSGDRAVEASFSPDFDLQIDHFFVCSVARSFELQSKINFWSPSHA